MYIYIIYRGDFDSALAHVLVSEKEHNLDALHKEFAKALDLPMWPKGMEEDYFRELDWDWCRRWGKHYNTAADHIDIFVAWLKTTYQFREETAQVLYLD